MDPIRNNQQHLHALLRRELFHHRLDVHDLHADVHSAHLPRLVAPGQEGAAGHRARGCGSELRGHVDQGGQCETGPVSGDVSRSVHMLGRSGVHPGDALAHRVCLVRFG